MVPSCQDYHRQITSNTSGLDWDNAEVTFEQVGACSCESDVHLQPWIREIVLERSVVDPKP